MLWFIGGSIIFLVLHQALEGSLVQGEKAVLRKFQWDMGTAVLLAGLVLAAVVMTVLDLDWRARFGPVVLLGGPVVLVGIGVFAYLSYLVYSGKCDSPADRESREVPIAAPEGTGGQG
ncbi:MAG: hypothetical protein PWP23_152 [Candidatus Sumerlaeota bacterium]|nr:hypothetical protein [Candidatus Sumerlaeota bacterium]